jgi:hypothetical protein
MREHPRDGVVDNATQAIALRGQIDEWDGWSGNFCAFGHLRAVLFDMSLRRNGERD